MPEFVLTIDNEEHFVESAEDLAGYLRGVATMASAEIWLSRAGFPALSALTNREEAFLIYFREEGDHGFASRNPEFLGASGEGAEFRLGNGQIDRYPRHWCVPKEKAFAAFSSFYETGARPALIEWHEE